MELFFTQRCCLTVLKNTGPRPGFLYVPVPFFFLNAEWPRSRRYGRTAALRLIVQPCDEEEEDDDDDDFLSFS
jgi:hypothetical protein